MGFLLVPILMTLNDLEWLTLYSFFPALAM